MSGPSPACTTGLSSGSASSSRGGPGTSVITWTMTSTITEWDRPRRFVDEQRKGPFKSFRHEHLFGAVEQRHRAVRPRRVRGPVRRARPRRSSASCWPAICAASSTSATRSSSPRPPASVRRRARRPMADAGRTIAVPFAFRAAAGLVGPVVRRRADAQLRPCRRPRFRGGVRACGGSRRCGRTSSASNAPARTAPGRWPVRPACRWPTGASRWPPPPPAAPACASASRSGASIRSASSATRPPRWASTTSTPSSRSWRSGSRRRPRATAQPGRPTIERVDRLAARRAVWNWNRRTVDHDQRAVDTDRVPGTRPGRATSTTSRLRSASGRPSIGATAPSCADGDARRRRGDGGGPGRPERARRPRPGAVHQGARRIRRHARRRPLRHRDRRPVEGRRRGDRRDHRARSVWPPSRGTWSPA